MSPYAPVPRNSESDGVDDDDESAGSDGEVSVKMVKRTASRHNFSTREIVKEELAISRSEKAAKDSSMRDYASKDDLNAAIEEAEEDLVDAKRSLKKAKARLKSTRRKAMLRVLRKLKYTERLVKSDAKKASMRECIAALKRNDSRLSEAYRGAERRVRLCENHLIKLRELKASSNWKARAKYFQRRAKQLQREARLKDIKAREMENEMAKSERGLAAVAQLVGDDPSELVPKEHSEDEESYCSEDNESNAMGSRIPRSPAMSTHITASPLPDRSKRYAHDGLDLNDRQYSNGASAAPAAGRKRNIREAAAVGENKVAWRLRCERNVKQLKKELAKSQARAAESERRAQEIRTWVTELKTLRSQSDPSAQYRSIIDAIDAADEMQPHENPSSSAGISIAGVNIEYDESGAALVQTVDEDFFAESNKWHKFSTRSRIDSYFKTLPREAERDVTRPANNVSRRKRRQKKERR